MRKGKKITPVPKSIGEVVKEADAAYDKTGLTPMQLAERVEALEKQVAELKDAYLTD